MMGYTADYVCTLDIDGDQKLTSSGETASCINTNDGPQCPLDSTPCTSQPECPLEPARGCVAGECSVGGTCSIAGRGYLGISIYKCEHTGKRHFGLNACQSDCIQRATCQASTPTCPLTGGKCKQQANGSFTCSAIECLDLEQNPPETADIDSRMYKDDGAKDAAGTCLGQVMLYTGRTMECRLEGKSTAFRSCCKGFDEIMNDSTGSIHEWAAISSGISATFTATKAAFSTYRTTSDVSQAAGGFVDSFSNAFNATGLAVSIAISLAIDYFVNNCNEMDMETGILNESGRCYETGQYCKSKWFGDCVQEAKTYCCFNSKMGRIIHEQGRSQLQSFVGVPNTDCRGFYAEEFQYLDFSKIDLSEYYGDIPRLPQSDVEANMNQKTQDFMDALTP
jgi:conjugal transfer mating pair stabilization protein TraN